MREPIRILLIEDDEDDVFLLREYSSQFHELDCHIDHESNFRRAQQAVLEGHHDLYLVDYQLNQGNGLSLIREAVKAGVDRPFILLTGHGSYDLSRAAMTSGAAEFIPKNELQPFLLERTILHVLERHRVMTSLARANQDKSRYLAMMSHEIRTPLTGIIGLMELMEEAESADRRKEYLQIAAASSKALLQLINDILDYTKIEAGEVRVEQIEFDLLETLEEAVELASFTAPKKEIAITLQWRPETPRDLIGDPLRLRQVLLNLLSNAVKFTDEGQVVLEVSLETSHGDTRFIRFRVIDSGIGMSEDELEQIFISFRQAKKQTSRIYGGSGLGLPICKNLVELMGGTLEVDSTPNKGSTFSFTLPLGFVQSREPVPGPDSADSVPSQTKRLLLVEDNPVNQMVVGKMLRRLSYSVDIAADRGEAEKAVSNQDYDLVFMDLELPGDDGRDITRDLRKRNFAAPIIALTAHTADAVRESCLECGMNDVLSKPVDAARLKHTLHKNGLTPTAGESQPRQME